MADVTVIIPCHNDGDYVGQAIESVLTQTDVPREVIVVDDASIDNTRDVVHRYAQMTAGQSLGRVTLISQKENGGVSKARNDAFDRSEGAYIAFLDADDLWLPTKTARQLELFKQHPDAAGTHCRLFNFRNEIDDQDREETELAKDDPPLEDMLHHHWVTTSTAMVRREALERFRFDETTGHAEDMILFADIRTLGPWRMVDDLLVAKRIHPTQATGSPWHRVWSAETRIKWCRQRAGVIGQDLAGRIENELSKQLVGYLENRYWRRELSELDQMRRFVADLAPDAMKQSFLHHKKLHPRWVYRVRDLFRGRSQV